MLLENTCVWRPQSLAELRARLKQSSTGTIQFLAGGTDLVPALKRQGRVPELLVALSQIRELAGVKMSPTKDRLLIGPLTKLAQLSREPLIQQHFAVLGQVAGLVASPQIRNQATVGGNIMVDNRCKYYNQSEVDRHSHGGCFKAGGAVCHLIPNATRTSAPVCRARFVSDLAPVLILAHCELVIEGPQGERRIALKDLYHNEGLYGARLNAGEILTRLEIPLPLVGKIRYEKLRIRQAIDFPSLGVALSVRDEDGSEVLEVCLTGVDTRPVSLTFRPSQFATRDDFWQNVAQVSKKSVVPLKQDFFPPQYKREMIAVLLKRLWEGN